MWLLSSSAEGRTCAALLKKEAANKQIELEHILTNNEEHTQVLQVKICICPSSIPLPLSCIAYKLQLEGKTRLTPLVTSSFRRSLTSLSVSNWTPIALLKIYQNNTDITFWIYQKIFLSQNITNTHKVSLLIHVLDTFT